MDQIKYMIGIGEQDVTITDLEFDADGSPVAGDDGKF
jgi:hypothetical protein